MIRKPCRGYHDPMPPGEHAIAIARVSARKQYVEDQTPGLQAFSDGQGYVLDAIIPIRGKSAYHGKHLKYVMKAINDYVRNGDAVVVIFREPDRQSRQGAQAAYDLRGEIIRAGARMEFSAMPKLNDQRTQESELARVAENAREESEIKSRRRSQGIDRRKREGKVNGACPWGYAIDRVLEILVPTPDGRLWIPKIFEWRASGRSNRSIALALKAAGVLSPQGNPVWIERSIQRIIVNPTYKGERSGKGNMQYEALVSAELWADANAALAASNNSPGRRPVDREPLLIEPVCAVCLGWKREGCPSGRSPMYRKQAVRAGKTYSYIACSGHGPCRTSCGVKYMPEAAFIAALHKALLSDSRPHYEEKYTAGNDTSEQLAKINAEIAQATQDRNYALVAQLGQQAQAIEETQEVIKATVEISNSGKTIGQHWASLTTDAERRDYLETAGVTVITRLDPVEGVVVTVQLAEGLYYMNGVQVYRHADGTVELAREAAKAGVLAAIQDGLSLTASA
jgi:DNA invertase Pin-like site-specific DNA recombinase